MNLLLSLVMAATAWAQPDLDPSLETFYEICRDHRKSARAFTIAAPAAGETGFFPVLALEATQVRFAHMRFKKSMAKALKEEPNWFAHDRRQSFFGPDKEIRVVFYRGKLFIADGHHRALISVYLGAQTIPAKVIADLSHLETAEFRAEMESNGWAHWRNYRNQKMVPRDLCDMADDPNLQLVRMLIRRVTVDYSRRDPKIETSTGSDFPLAIKINGIRPHLENDIANVLRLNGVVYDGDGVTEIPKDRVREYSKILIDDASKKSSRLSDVLLLGKPRDVAKLKQEKVVFKHIRRMNCESELL